MEERMGVLRICLEKRIYTREIDKEWIEGI